MRVTGASFDQIFLKTLFLGLKQGWSPKKLSLQERKRVIKVSANIAMAIARNDTNWGRALIARHSKHAKNRALIRSLLAKPCFPSSFPGLGMRIKGKFKRLSMIRRRRGAQERVLAESSLKNRTRILKRLVPGGKSLDDLTLLGETIDYVASLQAQVNHLKLLTQAFGVSNHS